MEKFFLEDYQAREEEKYQHYRDHIFKNVGKLAENFPAFTKFNNPIVIADRSTFALDKERIWSQIPFAGTLVIPLHPASKENMLTINCFAPNEIKDLIEMSKHDGKIQFVLASLPTYFEKMDHFDDIFTELCPSMLRTVPMETFVDNKTYELWKDEFDELAKVAYYKYLKKEVIKLGEDKEFFFDTTNHFAQTYARLKLLKNDELVEVISNNLIDLPEFADWILRAYTNFTDPMFTALHCDTNSSFSRLKLMGLLDSKQVKKALPTEIGRFLMKKITPSPSSYRGCIHVIEEFKQNELYKVLSSLSKGFEDRSKDKVVENVNQLNTILDNIWDETKRIPSQREGINTGIGITLGAIGEFAIQALGGFGGFFGGIGVKMGIDKTLGFMGKSLSNEIVRWAKPNYLMNVFDFQDKHRIN